MRRLAPFCTSRGILIWLVQEIKNFPNLPSNNMTLLALITFIHEKDLSEIYPNFWTALTIALTLPVTVAQAEKSFSQLKFIESYLSSTMSKEGLTGLGVISISHTKGEQISYNDITDIKEGQKGALLVDSCTI